jgi:hypothetical protein
VIASKWIVALVQMGFGSGPSVIVLWYQPTTQLSLKVSQHLNITHYFYQWLKPSSNMAIFQR